MLLRCCALLALLPLFCQAQNKDPFPIAISKKGLQVQMVDDALALGIKHAALNVNLSQLLELTETSSNSRHSKNGRTFFINEAYAKSLDAQIKPLSDAGVTVYLILLAYPSQNMAKNAILLHPQARADQKYTIAGFNTATENGQAHYAALLDFLAERYSGAHPAHGHVWGYIVGNEVNSQWMWYNLGDMSLADACREYEKAVRLTHDAVRAHSDNARIYLSFDHHWNTSAPGISGLEAYKAREFLDTFADIARKRGDFEWHMAHHPYPDDLGNPRTWEDKNAWPSEDSPHLTFKNLEVATRYMEKPALHWKGQPRRIILSEQGIHCLATPDGEALQAAGFAYAWEKVSRLPLIDALIWHRHVDHTHEGGLRLGLWENKPGSIADPGRKRPLYDVFKKADTAAWESVSETYLPMVGLPNWDVLPH